MIGTRKNTEATRLADPVGFDVGKARFRRADPGDGDEITPHFEKIWSVELHEGSESPPEEDPIVGFFRGALGGDKSSADRLQLGICQGAQYKKPASFGLSGFFDPLEI